MNLGSIPSPTILTHKYNNMAETREVPVQANFGEFVNNSLGNFLLGIRRQRAPIFSAGAAAAYPFLANFISGGVFAASFLNPIGLTVGTAALIGGIAGGALSYIFGIRRKIFQTRMPAV